MSSTREVPQMDWQQVVLNGGPPCFHVEDSRYCGRAERWEGHGHQHGFVSLESLLQQREQEVREACARLLSEGSDGIGGDWEAGEAAAAIRKVER